MIHLSGVDKVFSAQAEVFPIRSYSYEVKVCFLRASGGVSAQFGGSSSAVKFSPRKRRCFLRTSSFEKHCGVFSAQAEVFPVYQPN